MARERRERILDATLAEADARGIRGLTVEGVAARSDSSRATVYRHFPGGRDELIDRAIRREVHRFFESLVGGLPASADVVAHVGGLIAGADRLLREHTLLQRLLEEEADAILPPLATVHPMLESGLTDHLRTVLDASQLRPGTDVDEAADFCARMVLSFVGSSGAWDLSDPADVRDLVERHVVGPLLV